MKNIFSDSEIFYQYTGDDIKFGNQINKGSDILLPTVNSILIFGINPDIADSIRKELYETSYLFNNINVYDLGNLKDSSEKELITFFESISNFNINYVGLGIENSQVELILKNIKSNFLNLAFVEKTGKLYFDEKILNLYENSEFFNKSKLICYQTHLTDLNKITETKHKNSFRLGELRDNPRKIEPILRDIDMCFFNLDSIRYSEIPGIPNTTPSGLTSEEACQISKYLGLNPKNNFLSIFGYQTKFDFHNQCSMLISQIIWYYLEGLDQRIIEDLNNPAFVQTYMVELSDYQISLKFVQSKKTGRWWVEIPLHGETQTYLMPCSEEDYDMAILNELSLKIFDELGL